VSETMQDEHESSPRSRHKSAPPAGMFKVIVARDAQHHHCLSPSSGNQHAHAQVQLPPDVRSGMVLEAQVPRDMPQAGQMAKFTVPADVEPGTKTSPHMRAARTRVHHNSVSQESRLPANPAAALSLSLVSAFTFLFQCSQEAVCSYRFPARRLLGGRLHRSRHPARQVTAAITTVSRSCALFLERQTASRLSTSCEGTRKNCPRWFVCAGVCTNP